MTFIPVKSFDIFGYALCFDLSVLCRKCQNLMSGILDSTGFMAVYMTSLSCQYTLVSVQHGTDNCRIGLSSSYQKKHLCIRTATCLADLFFCRITVFICAIAGKLLHVCLHKFFKDRRMRSLAVIVYKK